MAQQTDHIGDTNKMVTAVEWLMSQIIDGEIDPSSNAIFLKSHINKVQVLDQAKQMEKEQMKNIWGGGKWSVELGGEFEQYYNEQYGGQGSPDTSPNTQNK